MSAFHGVDKLKSPNDYAYMHVFDSTFQGNFFVTVATNHLFDEVCVLYRTWQSLTEKEPIKKTCRTINKLKALHAIDYGAPSQITSRLVFAQLL